MTIFMFLYTNISRVPTDVSTSCSDASQWTEERDKKKGYESRESFNDIWKYFFIIQMYLKNQIRQKSLSYKSCKLRERKTE